MKLLNFTIIRICLILIFGILTGFYSGLTPVPAFIILGVSLLLFLLAFLKARVSLFPGSFFGISTYLIIFAIGITCSVLSEPENQAKHYINISAESPKTSSPLAKLRIKERLKPGEFNERYIAEVEQLIFKNTVPEESFSTRTHGKILLNIQKDSTSRELYAGNELLAAFSPVEIQAPLNPNQFDYKAYMSHLGVEKQLQLKSALFSLSEKETTGFIAKFRKSIIDRLRKENFSKDEMAIIQALLLGQRQEISKQIYEDYAAAGAVHILAVSGLHVGILLLILNFLLSPLDRSKQTKLIKTILLLFLLWGFAALAGFSASVVRAVAMFSFVAIGMQLNRRTSIMNSLFTSLFILLLINPHFIFQAGFQLSYLAVFSIIVFYKPITSIYSPRFKADRFIRDTLAVSISAQTGVLPLSLFYFHQFPGLFFLTNLVILPFLGLILCLGILVILLVLSGSLPSFLAGIFGKVISSMTAFITIIAEQEEFHFSDIHFSEIKLAGAYLVILALFFWIYKRTNLNLKFVLLSIILFQLILISAKFESSSEAIIFHQSRKSLIGIKENKHLFLYGSGFDTEGTNNTLNSYSQAQYIETNHTAAIRNIFVFEDKILLVIDSTGLYQNTGITPQLILLRDSPKINLERLIKIMKPGIIIADGSNYRSYISKWKTTCRKEKVPFHHTGEKGAFHILAGP